MHNYAFNFYYSENKKGKEKDLKKDKKPASNDRRFFMTEDTIE
jgi:hypothetical protein